jgi:hypothetical protein
VLEDKIRGGLIGQIFGNLNGLPHEFKYIAEPGKVEIVHPGLPEGAWTDDDTDIEWVYSAEMASSGELAVPPARLAELWRANMNTGIWCANLYARQLLDLGIEPPLTGRIAINPWSVFNISAQFVSESFGHIAPGHAADRREARHPLHPRRGRRRADPDDPVLHGDDLDGVLREDVEKIVDAGVAALDPKSAIVQIVADVRGWVKEHPSDWRETRRRSRRSTRATAAACATATATSSTRPPSSARCCTADRGT